MFPVIFYINIHFENFYMEMHIEPKYNSQSSIFSIINQIKQCI